MTIANIHNRWDDNDITITPPDTTIKSFNGILKSNAVQLQSSPKNQEFQIYKKDDDKRLVFGWASVAIKANGEQVVDLQNDVIDPEDLEEAVYEYVLNFRDSGEEHNPDLRKKGKLVESVVFTKEKLRAMGIPEGTVPLGWWIGFKIHDDDAWDKVKKGQYNMFSIEGTGTRTEIE